MKKIFTITKSFNMIIKQLVIIDSANILWRIKTLHSKEPLLLRIASILYLQRRKTSLSIRLSNMITEQIYLNHVAWITVSL
jgi:hypothetical protein